MAQRNSRLTGAYCERKGMISFIRSKKYILNIVLALIAMGIEFYYRDAIKTKIEEWLKEIAA